MRPCLFGLFRPYFGTWLEFRNTQEEGQIIRLHFGSTRPVVSVAGKYRTKSCDEGAAEEDTLQSKILPKRLRDSQYMVTRPVIVYK